MGLPMVAPLSSLQCSVHDIHGIWHYLLYPICRHLLSYLKHHHGCATLGHLVASWRPRELFHVALVPLFSHLAYRHFLQAAACHACSGKHVEKPTCLCLPAAAHPTWYRAQFRRTPGNCLVEFLVPSALLLPQHIQTSSRLLQAGWTAHVAAGSWLTRHLPYCGDFTGTASILLAPLYPIGFRVQRPPPPSPIIT